MQEKIIKLNEERKEFYILQKYCVNMYVCVYMCVFVYIHTYLLLVGKPSARQRPENHLNKTKK